MLHPKKGETKGKHVVGRSSIAAKYRERETRENKRGRKSKSSEEPDFRFLERKSRVLLWGAPIYATRSIVKKKEGKKIGTKTARARVGTAVRG